MASAQEMLAILDAKDRRRNENNVFANVSKNVLQGGLLAREREPELALKLLQAEAMRGQIDQNRMESQLAQESVTSGREILKSLTEPEGPRGSFNKADKLRKKVTQSFGPKGMTVQVEDVVPDDGRGISAWQEYMMERDRRKEANEEAKASQPKQLPSSSVESINSGASVARILPDVRATIDKNAGIFGPVEGKLRSMNKWDTTAQTVDAQMRAASQAFGRFMEGGVLRKEDEEKYRRMFPQLGDTADVAKKKLTVVERLLANEYNSRRKAFEDSGYDASGFEEMPTPPAVFETDTKKQIGGRTFIQIDGEWYEQ